jgi:hypothetical protein
LYSLYQKKEYRRKDTIDTLVAQAVKLSEGLRTMVEEYKSLEKHLEDKEGAIAQLHDENSGLQKST